MKSFRLKILYLLGISLWIPGISLFNVGSSGGLQICVLLSLISLILVLLKTSKNNQKNKNVNIKRALYKKNIENKLLIVHLIFLIATVACTMFSSIGVERSFQTAIAELVGLLFSVGLSFSLFKSNSSAIYFFKGFQLAGLLFSVYAVYQLIALPAGLPFAYLPMNNVSFALLNADDARFLGRALGLTPEPSILASLLLVVIGMAIVDLFLWPSYKQYLHVIVLVLGFLATSSQSIITLPIYVLVTLKMTRLCTSHSRILQRADFIGISFLVLSGIFVFFMNPSIGLSLGRLISDNSGPTQSGTARFNDFLVGLDIFFQHPIFGSGLGGYTHLASQVKNSLNLEGEAGASSSFLRLLCEQGLVGIVSSCIIFIMLFPSRLPRVDDKKQSALLGYHICTLISILISMFLFVGYRNLYHLWLLIPLGFSLKARLQEAKVRDLDSITTNTSS